MRQAMKKINYFRLAVVAVVSYLTVLSFAHIFLLENTDSYYGGKYFGYNPGSVFLFVGTAWLLWRYLKREKNIQKAAAIPGGLLLAAAIVYGAYVHYKNNIFESVPLSLLQLGMTAAISALTIPLFSEFFVLVEKIKEWIVLRSGYRTEPVAVKKQVLFFLLSWVGIFAAFLPLFLCEWPGNFNVDAPYQLTNVITGDYKTHHPLAHTLLMGKAYEFGCSIGNAAAGYQIYTLIQMLVLSSAFAYAGLYLYRKFTIKSVWLVIVIWYALFPIHMVFAITSTKDVLFAAFFLYFIIFLIRCFVDGEKFKWFDYVGFLLGGTGALLYRNNMSYALIVAGILTLLIIKGWKKKIFGLGMFVGIYLLASLLNHAMIEATDAYEGGKYRESLSVPLQCLARVAAYRHSELDEATYQEICMYMEEEQIKAYNPYISDPVKNTANEVLLETNFVNFLKLFIKTGLQFPDEYVESILTNTMGFWYPLNQGRYVSADVATYHMTIGMGEEIVKESKLPIADEFFRWMFFHQNYRNLPLVGYLIRNAVYFWGVIAYLSWCITKRKRNVWVPGLFMFVYIMTCFAGPTAAIRYVYCIVVTMPVLLSLMLRPTDS